MITAAVSPAGTAAPLAALLPTRKGVAWQVDPAPQIIRAGASTARLVQGNRALDVVEQDGRISVYADRHGVADAPDAVITETGPDPVAELAGRLLRVVLPRLDREAASATVRAHGREQVIVDGAQHLNEVGFSLIDHGAHVDPVRHHLGVGMTWTASNGAEWGVWVINDSGNLKMSYEGPMSGLYGFLPVVLPTAEGREPADVGSVFTRRLTDAFPQLRPLDAHEVEFGGHEQPGGWIALPGKDEPTDHADDSRRVVAEFSSLGPDLLLTAVSHLV
ncbi:hypothetical protein ACIQVL_03260 [Streptomyces sp. NPDC090499]|uniref:hypothetical protein n=1 Tax=Streptomyces sp. NPDC090499 TaxID=3365965 RepID=UPI003823F15B